jgi:hypothetical protein
MMATVAEPVVKRSARISAAITPEQSAQVRAMCQATGMDASQLLHLAGVGALVAAAAKLQKGVTKSGALRLLSKEAQRAAEGI